MSKKAAIYHHQDDLTSRDVRLYARQKDIDLLISFVKDQGYEDPDLYFDNTLTLKDRVQYPRLLESLDNYEVIVTKDFYHINRTTSSFIKDLATFSEHGVVLRSVFDGSACILKSVPKTLKSKGLRAVSYTASDRQTAGDDLQNEIFKAYVNKNTDWVLKEQFSPFFFDEKRELWEYRLGAEAFKDFDILIVRSFSDISSKTEKFAKARRDMGIGILSLKEGYMPADEVNI